jgi:prevent-host-death family protein
MRHIPQRELRNDSAAILRSAEAGEEFVITVDGRPVAALGPVRKRQFVPAATIRKILQTPTDPRLLDDIRRLMPDRPTDPFARRAKKPPRTK